MRREKLEHGMTTDTFCVKIAEGKRGGGTFSDSFSSWYGKLPESELIHVIGDHAMKRNMIAHGNRHGS